MLVTEGVRDAFRARARMTSATRRLLEARGFLEVGLALDTPSASDPSCHVTLGCVCLHACASLEWHAMCGGFGWAQSILGTSLCYSHRQS